MKRKMIISNNTRGAEATFLGYVAVNDGKILVSEFMSYVAEQMDRYTEVDVAATPDEDVSIELKNKLDGWIAESDEYGEDEVRNIEIMRGVKFNTEDRAFLVERFYRQKLDELEHEDEAERMALHAALFALPVEDVQERRHQELLDVIERGNVGAQAMDMAGRHPFLTGLLAPWVIDKVKGR